MLVYEVVKLKRLCIHHNYVSQMIQPSANGREISSQGGGGTRHQDEHIIRPLDEQHRVGDSSCCRGELTGSDNMERYSDHCGVGLLASESIHRFAN